MANEPKWRRYERLTGPDPDADVRDEIEFHLAMEADAHRRAGLPPDEARARAEREFGDLAAARDACRTIDDEGRGRAGRMERLRAAAGDLRLAFRRLRSQPAFAVVTMLTLALGIGATLTILTIASGVLLHPFAYADAGRLVRVFETPPGAPQTGWPTSYPNFADWKRQSRSFTDMALSTFAAGANLESGAEPERVWRADVSANLFQLLGVRPLLGRAFVAGEDAPGASAVAVLSEATWRSRYGADAGAIGRSIILDGQSFTIIGVMPDGIRFPAEAAGRVDLWTPLTITPALEQGRGNHGLNAIARLGPGRSVADAQSDVATIAAGIAKLFPASQAGRSALVVPLRESVTGQIKPVLLVMLGASALLLLMACANGAALLLTRAVGREREIAVLGALGASRWRIAQQLLVESIVLAAGGAAVGLGLAIGATRAIVKTAGSVLPRGSDVGIDWRVAVLFVGVICLTTLLFGLTPSVLAARTDIQATLRHGGRGATGGGRRARNALVVLQVAMSLVLLVGAGLLLRTFSALVHTNSGLRVDGIMTAHLPIAQGRYQGPGDVTARLFDPILDRLRAAPSVRHAALMSRLPLQQSGFNGGVQVRGQTYADPTAVPFTEFRAVSTDLFTTLGIRLMRGRDVLATDVESAPSVAVVNETFATRYLPNVDPVGQLIDFPGATPGSPPTTIIGVVSDVRESSLGVPPKPTMFFPLEQAGLGMLTDMVLVVQGGADASATSAIVRRAVREVSPVQSLYNQATLAEVIDGSVSRTRLYTRLLLGFAAIALLLAVSGIYGVVSYAVSQRTREFGVRRALGSSDRRLGGLVLLEGARLAGAGLAIGVLGALFATRLVVSLLYGVQRTDPLTYVAVAALLGVVTLGACYAPARRAARVEPLAALRGE